MILEKCVKERVSPLMHPWILGAMLLFGQSHLLAEVREKIPNFEIGASAGSLSANQFYGLDINLNMPITNLITSQIFINSDYLVSDNSVENYSQSEFAGNLFIRNDLGRFGIGSGFEQRKPDSKALDTEQTIIIRALADIYLDDVTLIGRTTEYDKSIARESTSTLGLAFYSDDEHRLSLLKRRVSNSDQWQFDVAFQPKEYSQQTSLGLQIRHGQDVYVGLLVNYYFDVRMTLKERYRQYH